MPAAVSVDVAAVVAARMTHSRRHKQALSASPHCRLLRVAALLALVVSVPLFLGRHEHPRSLALMHVDRSSVDDALHIGLVQHFISCNAAVTSMSHTARHSRHWRAASAMAAAAMPPAMQAGVAKGAMALGLPPEVLVMRPGAFARESLHMFYAHVC